MSRHPRDRQRGFSGLGPRGYSAVERLHRSGLTAADMWCLDSERRNTDGPPGISFRLLQVCDRDGLLPLCCQDNTQCWPHRQHGREDMSAPVCIQLMLHAAVECSIQRERHALKISVQPSHLKEQQL